MYEHVAAADIALLSLVVYLCFVRFLTACFLRNKEAYITLCFFCGSIDTLLPLTWQCKPSGEWWRSTGIWLSDFSVAGCILVWRVVVLQIVLIT